MSTQSLEMPSAQEQEMSRRSGPRRIAQDPVATERRVADRRRVPGLRALLGDIVSEGAPAASEPAAGLEQSAAS